MKPAWNSAVRQKIADVLLIERFEIVSRNTRPYIADVLLILLALALSAVTLVGYDSITDDALRVLLWPHAKITEAFYHITLPYQNGIGYVALERSFIISPACMGVRFIIMLFSMTICFFVRRFRGLHKIVFFALSLVGSIAVGVVASCVRIIGSIPLLSTDQFTVIHAGTGVMIYLITLVGVYILMKRITGGFQYEKQ